MAKRGQNEGSIFKRRDGRWVASLNLGYRGNKRWRKSFYGKTRGEVQERLKTELKAQQDGLPVTPERLTVAQIVDDWLEECVKPNLRARTYEGYKGHVDLHIKPVLGHIRLAKLVPPQVRAFLNDMLREGLSPRTVQYSHAVLRRALGQAVKDGLVARNVAKLVDPPRVERPEVEPLTPEQARAFLKAIAGDRLEALYSVAVAVGLRRGEALGLRWKDVDLEKGTIRVRGSLQRVDKKLRLVELKTKRSRRSVALPNVAVSALRRHRVRQLEERLLAGSRWQDTGMVFTTKIGTLLEPRNVSRSFHSALKNAGLPRKRFHDLRHTCASLLLVQDVHPRVVMQVLGHSQIGVTMDTYSHVIDELRRDAAGRMDALLAAE